MEKLVVRSSHLALRFYRRDGWTQDLVESLKIKGDLVFHDGNLVTVDGHDLAYWVGRVGSSFDIDKLVDHCRVQHYDRLFLEGDEARTYVADMNW